MARPRKDYKGPSAIDRMHTAFWELMEQERFEKVTASAVIKRAGVSPNTFYYHYPSYWALIEDALDRLLDPQLLKNMLASDGAWEVDSDLAARFHRVVLFATSGSGELTDLLRESLMAQWLTEMGLTDEELSGIQKMELRFIFSGVVSLLASLPRENTALNPAFLQTLFDRPLGKGILETIEQYSARG